MKKLFMVAIILMVGVGAAMAQKDVKAVGLNLNYGSEISNLGFGAKFQYGITDAIRIEPSFNYYLEKESKGLWDASVNVHYLFDVAEQIKFYPLAGLGYANSKNEGWSVDLDGDDDAEMSESYESGEFIVNLGVGAEYLLTEKLAIGAELKYQIINNFNQVVFGIGATYRF